MRLHENNKNSSFIRNNYRITNLLVSSFTFILVLAVILLLKHDNIINNVWLPIIITLVVIIFLSFLGDVLAKVLIKHSSLKRQREIEEKLNEENPNMNMYPINPKLYEEDLTQDEYDRLKSFRISNVLSSIILGLILVVIFIDFKSNKVVLDIILPLLIIIGLVGILACIFDFIVEKIIKFRMRVIEKIPKVEYKKPKNIFNKNKRIFYVPIYIILAFMCISIFIDFESEHVITHIVIPCEAITISTFIIILITDLIIDRVVKFKKTIEDDSKEIYSYSFDELDDMLEEERKDEK